MLKVNICGIDFKNPIITASGTFGFGKEYEDFFDINILGGISSKGLTDSPRFGNEGERLFETESGMINSIGLQNPGVDHFILHELPYMKSKNTVIIANLGGGSEEEYLSGARKLDKTDVDFIELNISCPNVRHGGMAFGIKADCAFDIVSKVRKATSKPLMVKLSPNCESITDMAVACEKAGADSLSLVNTFKAMAIDIKTGKPVFKNIFAGLSGPAIKPIALRMVYEVCHAVKIPVVGIGGIKSASDVIEFMMAGASAVQVGMANFIKPDICADIIKDLEKFVSDRKLNSINDIKGIV